MRVFSLFGLIAVAAGTLASCGGAGKVQAKDPGEPGTSPGGAGVSVGIVKDLNVDYGSHVQVNQVLATLEIPELQLQLKEDDAAVKNAAAQIPHAQEDLQSAESLLAAPQAKPEHDQALFDYAEITAPFAGVVTQRFANLGTLMQAGTSSSTQVLPLVRLSQDDLFRLVTPVPESYVRFIYLSNPVSVKVPSLSRIFPGTVARFSVDVREETRTMHTEGDVPNPIRLLVPGLYAEATITLEKKHAAIAAAWQAVDRDNNQTTVSVVDSPNKIEVRRIVLGIQAATDAEVLSGWQGGETVVVSDRSGLKAGQPV
jgi:multidrug efflux pump subunit AcrA (membrane-fusion protein)